MGFEIGKNVNSGITFEQLTKGLDKTKDKKKIDRIKLIFDKYNTNNDGKSGGVLDLDEQVSIMNAYHKADGDNDGNVTRKGLRKTGIKGEYKAYRDFMDAYQKAVGETDGKVDLAFKENGDIKATQQVNNKNFTGTIEADYSQTKDGVKKQQVTLSSYDGSISLNPKGQILRQTTEDGTKYQYDYGGNEARDAKPEIIAVKLRDNTSFYAGRQKDGTYLDSTGNYHFRLNNKAQLDEFALDNKNRVIAEVVGDKQFNYTFANENDTVPQTITESSLDSYTVYNREKDDIYSTQNNGQKNYFSFDADTKTFAPAEAPKPDPVKQERPEHQKPIKLDAGWKGNRIGTELVKDKATVDKFNTMTTADEILAELLQRPEYKDFTNIDSQKLTTHLKNNNPSMFDKDGIIYTNADWSKLDFPKDLTAYTLVKNPVIKPEMNQSV